MSGLISVVVPLFNQAAFVEKAIKSILCQTHHELELIVVDDGSTDSGPDIVENVQDNRIRLLRCDRGGPSCALNIGISEANGEFLAVMGADDISEPARLAAQSEDLRQSNLEAVFCYPTPIDERDRILGDRSVRAFFRGPESTRAADHLRALFYTGNYICAPTLCARRKIFERLGPFHEGLVQLQDWEYWIRMAGQGVAFAIRDANLIKYRRHRQSLSHKSRRLAEKRESLIVWRGFFSGIRPRLLRDAFSDILDPCADLDEPLKEDQIAMIYLSHPRPVVREMFAERLVGARRSSFDDKSVSSLDFDEFYGLMNRGNLTV